MPIDDRASQDLIDRYRPDLVSRDGGDESLSHAATATSHPDLALLLSTSGATGAAKLVRLSRENLDSNAQAIVQFFWLTSRDRAALILPLHYSYGPRCCTRISPPGPVSICRAGRRWRGTRLMHWLSGIWPAPVRVPAGE
jgi:long-subunit acyl-CoA synthetase (AMP-forming)